MAIDAFVKPFLSLPLFRGLKPLQLTEIVRRADRVVYKPGDTIISEDKAGDAAIVVISGECVRLSREPGAAGEPVAEGTMLGELSMLVETVYASTVVARGTVRALRISRDEMHALMSEDIKLAEHFSNQILTRLKKLAVELQAIDQALADIASFNAVGSKASQGAKSVALN